MTDGREDEVAEPLLPALRALLEALRAELELIDRVLVARETSA